MQSIDHYKDNGVTNLDELIKDHSGLVMKIAKSIKRKLPSNIDFDDLVQAGFVGLIEASKTFQEDHGATFETYASIRIKGAILDDLRRNSINNRDILKNMKLAGEITSRLEQKLMRPVTAAEIAAEMKISIEEYDNLCQYINISHAMNMDDDFEQKAASNDTQTPEDQLLHAELKDRLKKLLVNLPEREQVLLSLYYIEELTFKEISEVLDLTEARICQLHASSIAKLSTKI